MVDISGISVENLFSSSLITRVVTCVSNNSYVSRDDGQSKLKGIAIDLWRRTAQDLNLTYQIQVQEWWEMMRTFNDGHADVILQTMNHDQMAFANSTG